MKTPDQNQAAQDEALALRHVLQQPPQERIAALAEIQGAILHLHAFEDAMKRSLAVSTGITREDMLAMLDDPKTKKALGATAEHIRPAFEPAGLPVEEGAAAFSRVLANAKQTAQKIAINEARERINAAAETNDPALAADLMGQARDQLRVETRRHAGETLSELWERNRPQMTNPTEATKKEAIKLDPRRGEWSQWFNCWLGPRCGLEPGKNLFMTGHSGGGKTTLAAAVAVDAMAAGCPTLAWQMELGRAEMLMHLLAQIPGEGKWWETDDRDRANRSLPDEWSRLLSVPAISTGEDYTAERIVEDMVRLAHKGRRMGQHACSGLVVVDYAQLLTMGAAEAREASHEVLSRAASLLTKTASEEGLAIVITSQTTKTSRTEADREPEAADTDASGADFARMPDVALSIMRKRKPRRGDEDKQKRRERLAARYLQFTKDRGTWQQPSDREKVYYVNRALVDEETYNGDDEFV